MLYFGRKWHIFAKKAKINIIFIWKFINMSTLLLLYYFTIFESVCATTTIPFSKRLWPSCSVYSIFQNAVLLYLLHPSSVQNFCVLANFMWYLRDTFWKYGEMKKIPQKLEIQFSLFIEVNKVPIYVSQSYIFITTTFFD